MKQTTAILLLLLSGKIYADIPCQDERPLLLQKEGEQIGRFNYGHFLSCLQMADFDDDVEARKLDK